MKHIIKTKEPVSLSTYRSTPNANFDGCDKESIRLSLIKEQGALCAYCMQRISNEWNIVLKKFKTEIEHYKSQDVYNGENGNPDLRLNYSNMLGVCNGNAGEPSHKQHCDKSKDSEVNKTYLPLIINPLNRNCLDLIEYNASGIISAKDPRINLELNTILNLNEQNLVRNRKSAIDIAVQSINSKNSKIQKANDWKKAAINKEIDKWSTLYESGYSPFCQAVIFYLVKRLNKIQTPTI
jgi:uncharacterized protein (TIGR02646 family)